MSIEQKYNILEQNPNNDNWTSWSAPGMQRYMLGCCGCGLVHEIQYQVIRTTKMNDDGTFEYEATDPMKYRVLFRARQDEEETKLVREWLSKKKS